MRICLTSNNCIERRQIDPITSGFRPMKYVNGTKNNEVGMYDSQTRSNSMNGTLKLASQQTTLPMNLSGSKSVVTHPPVAKLNHAALVFWNF
jgi:hypothetical protein